MLSVADDARVLEQDRHAAWPESFSELFAQVAGVFEKAPARWHGRWYLLGLLSQQERKNSWWLAELAGEVSPDGMQRLLNFSPWDESACRDALGRYVTRRMGDPGAVLAVDETVFLKKGKMSAGVARMYTGTAGRIEKLPGWGVRGLRHRPSPPAALKSGRRMRPGRATRSGWSGLRLQIWSGHLRHYAA